MDVDTLSREEDPPSPSPQPTRKGKGKARATTADLSQAEHVGARRRTPEDGWDDAEMLEARQRSLRQTLHDRTSGWTQGGFLGAMQSGGAGPSRANDVYPVPRSNGPHLGGAAARDEYPSRAPSGGNRDRIPSRDRGHRTGPNGSGHPWDTNEEAWQQSRSRLCDGRARSEFVPLPNTRAAFYMAARGPNGAAANTLQRSPISRIRGRQRTSPSVVGARTSAREPGRTNADSRMHDDGTDEALHDDPAQRSREADGGMRMGRAFRGDPSSGDEDGRRGSELEVRDEDREWGSEDGEVLPTALWEHASHEDAAPTPIPDGGFPVIHRDDPETSLRGIALDWMREVWKDAPHTDVFVQIYNYRYTEDVVLNSRIAEALRWAFEQMSGECGFDVVPPELEEGTTRRQRDLPSVWVIRGLSPRATAHATSRGFWSLPTISFAALPRAMSLPSWLFTLEGFLTGNVDKIRATVLRVLRGEDMQLWIAEMVAANPAYAGWSTRRALEDVLDSLRVETMQLGNGTYIANVFIRSPTRSFREWRQWVTDLRARRYRSYAIGTGRVRIAGWNGPEPGEGVFGERRAGPSANGASQWHPAGRGGMSNQDSRRGDGERRGGRGNGAQRDDSDGHRRGDRNDRDTSRRNGRGGGNSGGRGNGSGNGNGRGRRNY
ncbi:hypothetical protein C8T65DRAFT_751347 [Cerioporus squamosus]|nr:hypothetical protein C8T65DRAFT_751347 [Cerioporus squamosus]